MISIQDILYKRTTKAYAAENYARDNEQALRRVFPDFDELCSRNKNGENDALIAKWLSEKGLSLDVIMPARECKICNDSGYIGQDVCQCIKDEWYREALRESGLQAFAEYDVKSGSKLFSSAKQGAELIKLYDTFDKFAEKYPNTKSTLLVISGGSGAGKSVAFAYLGKLLLKKNYSVMFIPSFEMHSIFLKYHTAPLNQKSSVFAPLFDVDFLIIDDLGTEPVLNNVTREYLYALLTTRQVKGKLTAVSTNLNLAGDDLKKRYDARVLSRFTDKSSWIKQFASVATTDLRRKK